MFSVWLTGMGVSALIIGFATNGLKYLISRFIAPESPAYTWATRVAAFIVGVITSVLAYLATNANPSFSGVWGIVAAAIASTGVAFGHYHFTTATNATVHGATVPVAPAATPATPGAV